MMSPRDMRPLGPAEHFRICRMFSHALHGNWLVVSMSIVPIAILRPQAPFFLIRSEERAVRVRVELVFGCLWDWKTTVGQAFLVLIHAVWNCLSSNKVKWHRYDKLPLRVALPIQHGHFPVPKLLELTSLFKMFLLGVQPPDCQVNGAPQWFLGRKKN